MDTENTTLTRDEADAFGRELDALRDEVVADLGQRDVDHIRRVIGAAHYRRGGRPRCSCTSASVRSSFVAGVGALALSKILENMEIGHNVMHGQYDWTAIRRSTRTATSGTSSAPATIGATRTTTSTTRSPTSSARIATSATCFCA